MSDGSNLGITASRALGTILGGEEQPKEEEKATREQVEQRVRNAPLPVGTPIWEREDVQDSYSLAADAVAHAFLVVVDENPELLNTVEYYPDDYEVEILRGKQKSPEDAVWNATIERWPNADDFWGGVTGFMVSFAYNTVRYIKEEPPKPNSAIIEIA